MQNEAYLIFSGIKSRTLIGGGDVPLWVESAC